MNKGWIIFIVLIISYTILKLLANTYVFTDQFFYRSLSDQLTQQSIEALLNLKETTWWVNYGLIPLTIFFKVSFVAICISIGSVLSIIEFKFKSIFKAALLAEVVFITAQALYLINISFHLDTVTLEMASNYYPLSALSYFGTENVVQWLQYPLQTLNVFEVLYMVVIAWLLSKQWKEDFMESLALVVPSYGTGLILWLVFVTFITLQIS